MSLKLRDFIKDIRKCNNIAEEHVTISREFASIRNAFKEGKSQYVSRNITKLLLINMLGYPTLFGQFQCLKLIASSNFSEKRLGYLGIQHLRDENSDIIILLTNSLRNDLLNTNQYINGLALTALINLSCPNLYCELYKEILCLCESNNCYIKKKALICAAHFVKNFPEEARQFLNLIPSVFDHTNHNMLLTSCIFISSLIRMNIDISSFTGHIVTQILEALNNTICAHEFSVGDSQISHGSDSFLQVKLLKTLQILKHRNDEEGAKINKFMIHILNVTNSKKDMSNAVRFQCLITIFSMNSVAFMKVEIEEILTKFFNHKDNNIRYIGLTCLIKLLQIDISTVHQLTETVLTYLEDSDTSIQQSALDVIFNYIEKSKSIIHFNRLLKIIDNLKKKKKTVLEENILDKLVFNLFLSIEKYSTTRIWQLNASLALICIGNHYVNTQNRDNIIFLVNETPELRLYATIHSFNLCKKYKSYLLLQLNTWLLGEYGHLVIHNHLTDNIQLPVINVEDIVIYFENCISSCNKGITNQFNYSYVIGTNLLLQDSPEERKQLSLQHNLFRFILYALFKLINRLPQYRDTFKNILIKFKSCVPIDLEQRYFEYLELSDSKYEELIRSVIEPIICTKDRISNHSALINILDRPLGIIDFNSLSCQPNQIEEPKKIKNTDLLLFDEASNLVKLDCLLDISHSAENTHKNETSIQMNSLPDIIETSNQMNSLPDINETSNQMNSLPDIFDRN